MRKRLLLILLCCAGLCALAGGGALWWASGYMRTPEFRGELAQLVHDATGHNASLSGELSISFFPWFGLRAEGVRLDNDPAFGPVPLLSAREISAHVKVLPLFRKRLVFDTLELTDADLTLSMDAEGRGNWEGLVEHLHAQENATDNAGTYFQKVTVRGVRLIDSRARLDDHQHNHSYIATGIDLRTGRIESGKPLPFTVTTDFLWPRPGLTAHLEGAGKLHWSKADPGPIFSETKIQGEIGGTFMPKLSPKAGISTVLSLEDGGKHLKLSDVQLRLIGSNITGEITFLDVTEMFRLEARLQVGRFSPRAVINAYWPGTIANDHHGALASAEGPLNIHADVDQLVFETPGFGVDESHLKGRVRMGFGDVSGLDFELGADKLDADGVIAAFNSNATGSPLVVGDLPMAYLREVKGAGHISAGTLKLAGVSGQGAQISWAAGEGRHRMQLAPLKAQGGTIAADLTTSFADGQPLLRPTSDVAPPAVLGWAANLRMDGVDARQTSWLNTTGFSTTGRMDLRAKAEAKPAPSPAAMRLGLIVRRAAGEAQASLGPAQLDWAADKAQGRQARRMLLSSLQAQAHFVPVPAGDADWAVQLDGGLSAVGTRPLLNLEAKVSGKMQNRQGKTLFSGATASGHLKGWFLPKAENDATFAARGALDVAAQSLTLSSASLSAFGLNLSGAISGSKVLGSAYSLSGRVRCQDGDPKRALAALEVKVPKSADKRALSRISGEADLVFGAKGLALSNIAAQLDSMPFNGSYSVQDFDAPKQTLALSGGNFDLDRYLPAPEPARRGVKPERPTPEPLPVEALRDLNLTGNIALRSFKYRGLTTRDFRTTVNAHGGSLLLKPLGGSFYGGTLTGEFSAQVAPGGMQTRLALAAKDFQAGPFMTGWAGKEVVTGKTDLFLDLSGAGATDQDVLRTLDGLGSFKVTDGSYNLSGGSEQQPAPAVKRPAGASAQPTPARKPGAAFHQVSAHLKVHQGVFRSEDFRMEATGRIVTGKGQFCPADDTISVNLTANMPGMPDVPIRVFGRLKDPEMEISTGALIGNTIKEILGIPLRPVKFFKDLLF